MKRFAAIWIMCLLGGCASIVSGTTEEIDVTTSPDGADCILRAARQPIGRVDSTPGSVSLKKTAAFTSENESGNVVVKCRKPGYQEQVGLVRVHLSGWVWGNIILLPLAMVGVVIDSATGAFFWHDETIHLTMEPEPLPQSAPELQVPPTKNKDFPSPPIS